MLVPDEVRKCVVFVCARFSSGVRPCGTVFLFMTLIEGTDRGFVDVITARHVIEGIRKQSTDAKVILRFNTKAGSHTFVESDAARWDFHPNASVDVAVMSFAIPSEMDVRYLGPDILATEETINKFRIGIGDDVFITGLFVNHYGAERNIPILRVGNIAATPSEMVETRMGPMEAYLIEARSIGGLSGSPVFVYLDALRQQIDRKEQALLLLPKGEGPVGGRLFLLGLIHGHYDVRVTTDDANPDGLREEAINMGIAIVVPVSKIMETINQPTRIALRKKVEDELKRG